MLIPFLWICAILGAIGGGVQLVETHAMATSAPQQATGAVLGVAAAIIPYCLARAVSELAAAGRRKPDPDEKAHSASA